MSFSHHPTPTWALATLAIPVTPLGIKNNNNIKGQDHFAWGQRKFKGQDCFDNASHNKHTLASASAKKHKGKKTKIEEGANT
ncbi:hypothetical protein Tco_1012835 [Tanacetum coccineum]